jgi:hypothetical protein
MVKISDTADGLPDNIRKAYKTIETFEQQQKEAEEKLREAMVKQSRFVNDEMACRISNVKSAYKGLSDFCKINSIDARFDLGTIALYIDIHGLGTLDDDTYWNSSGSIRC